MYRISKPGVREMSSAGSANKMSRVIELNSGGSVLPVPVRCLAVWSKTARNWRNESNVYEERHELSGGRHTTPQHYPPNLGALPNKLKTKSQVVIFLFERNYDQHVRDEN